MCDAGTSQGLRSKGRPFIGDAAGLGREKKMNDLLLFTEVRCLSRG